MGIKLLLLICELNFLPSTTMTRDIFSFNAKCPLFSDENLYILSMREVILMASFQMYHSGYSV